MMRISLFLAALLLSLPALAQGVDRKTPNGQLANPAVTLNGHSLPLGGALALTPADLGPMVGAGALVASSVFPGLSANVNSSGYPGMALGASGHWAIYGNSGDAATMPLISIQNDVGSTNPWCHSVGPVASLDLCTTIDATNAHYVWPISAVMNVNVSAASTYQENVGIASTVYKVGSGSAGAGTWGFISQNYDLTGMNNPTVNQIGMEIDIGAGGGSAVTTDNFGHRMGLQIMCEGPGTSVSSATHCGNGIVIQDYDGAGTFQVIDTGVALSGTFGTGLNFANGSYLGSQIQLSTSGIGITWQNPSYTATNAGQISSTATTAGAQLLFLDNTTEFLYGSTDVFQINAASINAYKPLAVAGQLTVYGPIQGASLVIPAVTIASLPTCNAAMAGAYETVSNGVATPTYMGPVSTTGSSIDPVFCNGSAWVYH